MPEKRVLLATEKPFSGEAVTSIENVLSTSGYKLTKLEKYQPEELKKQIAEHDAIIVRSDKITGDSMDASAGALKLVVRAGAGVDTIDLQAATDRGIVVMNTPGQNSNAVAELAFGMMITNARNHYDGSSGYELRGKTLALYGFGQVARNMHRLAKAFDMKVLAYDPFVKAEDINATGATAIETIPELFQNAQFVSLHIPCTPQTKHSIGYDFLNSMPKNGVLINTARADVINEGGLVKAFLERGDLRYITDVNLELSEEGVKADFEKLGKERVFATKKKMGAQTAEANNNAGIAAAKQIVDFFEKGDAKFQVNKPGQTF